MIALLKQLSGRVVELATNCYGTHVIQKALECEEDIKVCLFDRVALLFLNLFKRVIVEELLENDPSSTLTSKHCR